MGRDKNREYNKLRGNEDKYDITLACPWEPILGRGHELSWPCIPPGWLLFSSCSSSNFHFFSFFPSSFFFFFFLFFFLRY